MDIFHSKIYLLAVLLSQVCISRLFCLLGSIFLAKTRLTLSSTIYYTSVSVLHHPRRPRGNQSGREKRRNESFQVLPKEPLGTDSHRAMSKTSSGCRILIGHKNCFVLLCPIGEQFLLSSFREFVHDGYCFDHGLSGSCTKEMHAVRKLSV